MVRFLVFIGIIRFFVVARLLLLFAVLCFFSSSSSSLLATSPWLIRRQREAIGWSVWEWIDWDFVYIILIKEEKTTPECGLKWNGAGESERKREKKTHDCHTEREKKKCGARTCLKVDFGWHIDYALSPSIHRSIERRRHWTSKDEPSRHTVHQQQSKQKKNKKQMKNQQNTKQNTDIRRQIHFDSRQQQQKVAWNFQQIFVNRLQHSLVVEKFAHSLPLGQWPLDNNMRLNREKMHFGSKSKPKIMKFLLFSTERASFALRDQR